MSLETLQQRKSSNTETISPQASGGQVSVPSPRFGDFRLVSQRLQEGNERRSLLRAQLFKMSGGIACFAIVPRDSIFKR